jgi:uncharacterized repeat protein (TIGR03803 family)
VAATVAQAQLYTFTGGSDGGTPEAALIRSPSGKLYGSTYQGGDLRCNAPFGCGVVYKLNSAGKETVLHRFSSGKDGENPLAPVARDSAGNLYGTTYYGGSAGFGAVFEIDSAGKETVLHSFTGRSDGCFPAQGLLVNSSAELFGTTWSCGSYGFGTIFKLDTAGRLTVLHSFAGGSSDGEGPAYGHLTADQSRNFYGLTAYGGAHGYGALYKLSEKGTLTLLHSFAGGASDGCQPYGSAMLDNSGNLYGTTYECGSDNSGTLWRVSNKGKEAVLYNFTGSYDGCLPVAGVTRDPKGNLYGVTEFCGGGNYEGVLYEFTTKGRLIPLERFFGGITASGVAPIGEVLRTAEGTVFGTNAYGGGEYGHGTVWKYVP